MRKTVHYYGLDLLRFGAAWLVVADHFGSYGWASPTTAAQGEALAFPSLNGMEYIGSIGVEIFFLISGFVIAASAKGSTATHFLLSRAVRVFPALWLCGLVALVARLAAGEPLSQLAGYYVRSATLSPAGPYIDGVVWTLVVEAAFYALIFCVLLRDGFGRIETVAKVLGVFSAAFLIVMASSIALSAHSHEMAKVAAICERFPFKVLLLRHGVFFAAGIMVWSGFERGFTASGLRWIAALAFFCSLEICLDRGGPTSDVAVALALWWSGFAAILFSVAEGERVARWASRWSKPLQNAGRFSYPLYLNHYVLGMVLVPALFALGLSRPVVLILALALVSISSWLIMLYPERWAQRALRSRLLGRSAKPKGDMQTSPALG